MFFEFVLTQELFLWIDDLSEPIKDFRILRRNRKTGNIFIVDAYPQACALKMPNLIPIKPYNGPCDDDDPTLILLERYIVSLRTI